MSAGLGLGRSRAFDVARRAFSLPDLTALEPVAKVTDPVATEITTTFYDTADLRLAARNTSVWRTRSRWLLRTQGEDGTVVEVEADSPSPDGTLPHELGEMIHGSVRDKPVEPVASIRTARVERRLLDIDGRELACIADDVIDGQRFTTGSVELSHWRQLTVELIGGDADLLELVVGSLDRLPELAPGDEMLHRALGWTPRPAVDLRGDDRDASAVSVVRDRLRTEVRTLVDGDWAVRTGRPDAVRDMRAAALRLRCDLATWKPYLDAARTDPVRRELRWFVAVLGRVRDAVMLDARLGGTIDGLPADMVVGPVPSRIAGELAERRANASDRLHAALDGGRYFALLDRLESLAAEPPFTARAEGPADELLVVRLSHALGRLDRALAELDAPAPTEERADQLHSVHNAARRAACAAEVLEPRFERRARRLADQMRGLQDLLEEHRDSVVARRALAEIGAVAHVAGESAFTYGVLHGIERDRGEEAERAFEAARGSLAPAKLHRWATG